MATITLRIPEPYAAQAQILAEARRFNVVCLGRRTGKTTLGQHQLIHTALDGLPAGYFAPTYKLLADTWRDLRNTLATVTSTKSETEHRLELITGGTIECWSLDDPDPARGRRYKRIVVDEAAMVRNLRDVWQLALRSTLADFQGDAWFLSTPQGLNDFYALFQLGMDPLEHEWQAWQMPTSVNPYIAAAELDAARHDMTERAYRQEIEAQFLSLEGAGVFRGVHAVSRLEPEPPIPSHAYVFGVDWGRSNDFTAISVIDASVNEQVALDRFTQIDYEFQSERLHRWAEAYHPRAIVAESNSMGGPLVERLQSGYARLVGEPRRALPIIPWQATNATKAAVIQALSLAIEQGQVTLLDDAVQTGELLAYEATRLPSGILRYGAPEGAHDDTVVALALAWLGAGTQSETRRSSYAFANGRSR